MMPSVQSSADIQHEERELMERESGKPLEAAHFGANHGWNLEAECCDCPRGPGCLDLGMTNDANSNQSAMFGGQRRGGEQAEISP